MVRLRTLLLAGIVAAAPVLIQAADFKWYASDRQGWWFITEKPSDSTDIYKSHTYSTFTGANNNTFVNNSRWGAKIKADQYAGQIEFAVRHPKNADAKANVRQAWGQWNFTDKLGLTIGITDAPFVIKNGPQGYWEQVDQGKFSGKRYHNDKVMLYQLNYNPGYGISSKLALVNNDGENCGANMISGPANAKSIRQKKAFCKVPQIEAAVAYKNDLVTLDLQGGWQTFVQKYRTGADSVNSTATNDKKWTGDFDVNSWVIGGDVCLKLSIANLIVGFSYGANTENMGVNTSYKTDQPQYGDTGVVKAAPACVASFVNGEVKKSTQWGVPISLTLNFSKKLGWVLGYGICGITEDKAVTASGKSDVTVTQSSYYTNLQWKPYGGLTLAPEIGYIDFDKKNLQMSSAKSTVLPEVYYGFFTQIDL